MTATTAPANATPEPYNLHPLANSWLRSLRARSVSENTQRIYSRAAAALADYLLTYAPPPDDPEALPAPTELEGERGIHRQHIELFITQLTERTSATTAHQYFRSLKTWFGWLVNEEEMDRSPMRTMKAPTVDEAEVPVIPVDSLKRLVKVCAGKDFESRRDLALIMMFLDTGGRLSEITERTQDKLDIDLNVIHLMGKGGKERPAPFGRATSVAMDRYLRAMGKHIGRKIEPTDPLWISVKRKDALTISGVSKMIGRRCKEAGLPHIHPHQFRHTFAHLWKLNNGNEDSLMRIMGWRSREMLNRYGRSAGEARAQIQHRDLSPGDRL